MTTLSARKDYRKADVFMSFELGSILKKINGGFICVFNGKRRRFLSVSDFEKSGFGKSCTVESISAQDGIIVIELKSCAILSADSNAEWVKEYEEKYGSEISFF